MQVDPKEFRNVLGRYPTGVVIVTAVSEAGEALGMTVGSFGSVSLDPPLVAFMPDKKSSSWKRIQESGSRFCVNVLHADQEDICRLVAVRKQNKLEDIPWHPSVNGNPIIEGCVAFIDCEMVQAIDAGDHLIVIGHVDELEVLSDELPLLFFAGGYGSFIPRSLAAADIDLMGSLQLVDMARPAMDRLAATLGTEVLAMVRVGNELVIAASSGSVPDSRFPTRVGFRYPFVPPFGSVFVAWGPDDLRDAWISMIDTSRISKESLVSVRESVSRIQERGYSLALESQELSYVESMYNNSDQRDPKFSRSELISVADSLAKSYNPPLPESTDTFDLKRIAAPVFNSQGEVAYSLIIVSDTRVTRAQMVAVCDELKEAAKIATIAIGGVIPAAVCRV